MQDPAVVIILYFILLLSVRQRYPDPREICQHHDPWALRQCRRRPIQMRT